MQTNECVCIEKNNEVTQVQILDSGFYDTFQPLYDTMDYNIEVRLFFFI